MRQEKPKRTGYGHFLLERCAVSFVSVLEDNGITRKTGFSVSTIPVLLKETELWLLCFSRNITELLTRQMWFQSGWVWGGGRRELNRVLYKVRRLIPRPTGLGERRGREVLGQGGQSHFSVVLSFS